MKTKITLFLALVLSSLFISAQTVMNIHQSNGTMLQLPLNTIDSITYTISNPGNLAALTTLPIGNITTSGATSGGNITNDGGTSITSRGICWAISSNPTTADNSSVNGSGTGSFTSNLSGLTPNTIYYVRAYAINSAGTAYGNELSLSITYDESKIPVVTTLPVDSFGPSNVWASAYLKGIVVSENGGTVTGRGFCWDTLSTVDVNSNKSENGAGTGSFSHFIDDLEGNKPYFVRAYAINSFGTAYGDAVYFLSDPTLAKVTTTDAVSIDNNSAILGGNVFKNGGATVTSRGVCWSTSSNPTLADNSSVNGSGIGSFTSNLTGLTKNTIYYVRGYAINSAGTSYGNELSFTTTSTSDVEYGDGVTDAGGNTYQSVIIGAQEWMSENLRTTKYSDGAAIPNITDNTAWSNLSTGAWCNYNNSSSNDAIYGKLYSWYAVETGKLCPTGWHVPTDAELTVLTDYLAANGHDKKEGKALRATSGWGDYAGSSGNGTDDYGFSALPGGNRYGDSFEFVGSFGYWWSSSQKIEVDYDVEYAYRAWGRHLVTNGAKVYRFGYAKGLGFSVRCLRD